MQRWLTIAIVGIGWMSSTWSIAQAKCLDCDKRIHLSGAEADCLHTTLVQQLQNDFDPLVVSISGCHGAVRDATRHLDLPVGPSNLPPPTPEGGPTRHAFMLDRSDGRCLEQRLRDRRNRLATFDTDLSTC
jgi:hypothetical protein